MLLSATYLARPHADPRRHAIPTEVIKQTAGGALDGKLCLLEILVVKSGARKVKVVPPVALRPTSGGEVYVPRKACPEYPEEFAIDDYLVVRMTMLEPG